MQDFQLDLIKKAEIIVEALPYINKLSGKTIVIKYGGGAMTDPNAMRSIMQDIVALKIVGVNPVLVHGGGPEINSLLKKLNIQAEVVDGYRVTNKDAMELVQMVLSGKINKDIAGLINSLGAKAVGLCGKDANLIKARKLNLGNNVDYGYAGEVVDVDTSIVQNLTKGEYIPVISSVGTDEEGHSFNINADSAASAIAIALKAEKLIFLTDIDGVRAVEKDADSLIPALCSNDVEQLISSGVITGGMIPKVRACADCVKKGVSRVHIINGTILHPILLEIFTDKGIGTMFY